MSQIQPKKILPLLMVNMFIVMLGVGLVTPILPALITDFGASGQTIGFLVAAYGITQFVLSPITGKLSDQYGRKLLIVAGVAIFALAKIIFAIGSELWMLYGSRLLEGVAAALLVPPMMAYVADMTTTEERAKGNGLLGAAMSLGFVIGPGLGGLLAGYGLRVPLYAAAGAAVLAVIISVIGLPEPLSKDDMIATRAKGAPKLSILRPYADSLKSNYAALYMIVFVMTFGLANFESIFGLYVTNQFQFTPQAISVILTAGAVIGVGMQALLVARVIKAFGEQLVIQASLLFTSFAFAVLLLVRDFWTIFLVTSCIFFAMSLLRPALNTRISKMAGNEQGAAAGMNNAYISLGNILGPSLAGLLFDVDVVWPFLAGCLILLVTFLMTLRLK
ncbi:MFS transporter [Paenibacillus elgii]|uniref:MFS transporter n=1 Tax=Paenibacillus elgii TaxID=189691 RepID=UPI00204265B1|nr:MFS transporter [Paenibacillus elgii]MCM3269596.1 MFS transporter [Paenibacillus elgii]